MVTSDQDSTAAWETLTNIFCFLGEDGPLLARVAARVYTLGDLEKSSRSQRKIKTGRSEPTHRLRITAVLKVEKFYPDTLRQTEHLLVSLRAQPNALNWSVMRQDFAGFFLRG